MKFRITPMGFVYPEDDFDSHNEGIDLGDSDDFDEVEISDVGCSDTGCEIAKLDQRKRGTLRQGTNGGCGCFNHIANIHTRGVLRQYIRDLQ